MDAHQVITTSGRGFEMGATSGRSADTAFCIMCETQVRLLTLDETEQGYGIDREEIVRRGQKGTLHWLHNSRGQIRVCSGSLVKLRSMRVRSSEVVILSPLAGITGRL